MAFVPRHRGLSDYHIKMMFIMPTMVLLIVMNIFPLLWSLYLSFCRYRASQPTIPPKFISFANYTHLLSDPQVWGYFIVTAKFVVMAVSAQFLIGFGLALLLNREFRGKGVVTTLILVPMMLSPVVVGMFWRHIMDADSGLLTYLVKPLLRPFGMHEILWTSDPKVALYSVVLVDTWMWSPFMMLISLAGLSAVPRYLYEAAEVDRASAWFKFRRITLPLVAPLLLLALLFRTMDAFKLFDLVFVLTKGGPGSVTETVSMNLYKVAFEQWDTGRACAMAYVLLIIIVALSNIYVKYLNKFKEEG